MTIRSATLDEPDLDAIVHQRRAIYLEGGHTEEATLDAMSAAFRSWLRRKMESGEFLGWFALAPDSSIAGGIGLWLMDYPPSMRATGGWRANIINVYTEPSHRRRGMARCLMQAALDWCAANCIGGIVLHATPAGRPLYESLGFLPRAEMELIRPVAR
jgi:GNAT superfamily N-acetyltransferase